MRIAISGASGLIGSALRPYLSTLGHEALPLSRKRQSDGSQTLPTIHCDGVVHLAGENIAGGRWNTARKCRIRDSRVDLTRRLCEALARMPAPPRVLVCASAVGYYGDTGDTAVDESRAVGAGFLAELSRDWEDAAEPARTAGIRVVHLRIGLVLSRSGGALAKLLPPFRMGLGGMTGDGRQWMSWIHLDDLCRMIAWALDAAVAGPVNAVAPNPVTNAGFTEALGRVLRRPTFLTVPKFALRLLLGEMADALLLASTRAVPRRASELGFEFRHPELLPALSNVLQPDGPTKGD
jgi:hypothetical protein